jgi:hypothetical protein
MHEHDGCKHKKLKYCDICDIVYCEECHKEWKFNTFTYIPYYPYTYTIPCEKPYDSTITIYSTHEHT